MLIIRFAFIIFIGYGLVGFFIGDRISNGSALYDIFNSPIGYNLGVGVTICLVIASFYKNRSIIHMIILLFFTSASLCLSIAFVFSSRVENADKRMQADAVLIKWEKQRDGLILQKKDQLQRYDDTLDDGYVGGATRWGEDAKTLQYQINRLNTKISDRENFLKENGSTLNQSLMSISNNETFNKMFAIFTYWQVALICPIGIYFLVGAAQKLIPFLYIPSKNASINEYRSEWNFHHVIGKCTKVLTGDKKKFSESFTGLSTPQANVLINICVIKKVANRRDVHTLSQSDIGRIAAEIIDRGEPFDRTFVNKVLNEKFMPKALENKYLLKRVTKYVNKLPDKK